MSRHCFAYGSLMCEDIIRAVSGCALAGEPAQLADFVRRPVVGETYPGIVPEPGGRVTGVLYRDVPPAALLRLDAFEGERYAREPVVVTLSGGARVAAETYVFRAEFAPLLGAGEWDFERFLRHGKREFEARHLGPLRGPR